MVFSSPVFLFIFLPVTLLLYAAASLSGKIYIKNAALLTASICFYGYGGLNYLGLLALSVFVNWLLGLWLDKTSEKIRRLLFVTGLVWNIGILVIFKYLNLLADTAIGFWNLFADTNAEFLFPRIVLPIGISFFTFQIMSYLIDVYRKVVPCQKSFWNLALYIMLFPQLIAGPIVRYADVEQELACRSARLSDVYEGSFRFLVGFSKKILFANAMGKAADLAFALKPGMGLLYAWSGIICYSLQIYLDFWAYSDMAIGLGRIFGFHFPENFRDPYVAESISDFWRRWHISLSSWFRDYVYIPLGGSRCSLVKTCRNSLIVFALTGIWHGASWNFLIWGLYFACFLILERLWLGDFLKRIPSFFRHVYVLFVVAMGWVWFRAETLERAVGYFRELFSFCLMGSLNRELAELVTGNKFLLLFVVSVIYTTPCFSILREKLEKCRLGLFADGLVCVLFFLAICEMMASGYNPFIYFRF